MGEREWMKKWRGKEKEEHKFTILSRVAAEDVGDMSDCKFQNETQFANWRYLCVCIEWKWKHKYGLAGAHAQHTHSSSLGHF